MRNIIFYGLLLCFLVLAADSRADDATSDEIERPSVEELQGRLGLNVLANTWSGDLSGMVERRVVRVLTVYGLARYFIDEGREKGVVFETMSAFEASLNEGRQLHEKVHVLFVPVARDQLIPALLDGRGDVIVAGMTIIPERQELVDFSMPVSKPIREILVTGPSASPLNSLDDLAGKTVAVRESSSYYASLQALNARLAAAAKPVMQIRFLSELLEDEDLLEMVAAGLLPWVVVDDYKAEMFTDVFESLTVRHDLVLREGAQIGYAFRKDSPELAAKLNAFVKEHKQGTTFGNILINRYVKNFNWVENALDSDDFGRFEATVDIFRKYGERYGTDYLLVAAQGYQESRLDQSVTSHAGAVGIMQLLPSTAADSNVGIPDISTEDANIHAGVRYLDFIRTRYFSDPAIDPTNQTLLAMAAYNAGPNRISGLRGKAAARGLDPNKWFGNVEIIVATEVGREPVQYVANIYKYYATYKMAAVQMDERLQERRRQGLQ